MRDLNCILSRGNRQVMVMGDLNASVSEKVHLTATSDGSVLVADEGNNPVAVFDKKGGAHPLNCSGESQRLCH